MLFSLILLVYVSFCSGFSPLEEIRMNQEKLTGECADQIRQLSSDPKLAFTMIDSSAKFVASGEISGNGYDLGLYDECLRAANDTLEIYGKYCLVTVMEKETHDAPDHKSSLRTEIYKKLKKIENRDIFGIGNIGLSKVLIPMQYGICIPNKCNSDQIEKLHLIKLDDSMCSSRFTNSRLDTKPIIALVFLSVVIVIALVSTIYDLFLDHNGQKPKHLALVAFSLYTNGKKLFKSSNSPDQLSCLNGLKTLNMLWVILGHTFLNLMVTASPDNILDVFVYWVNEKKNMLIMSAPLSVDSFFTIGGLLTVYVYMKASDMKVSNSIKQIPLLYIHRYIRLTPAYAVMILIYGSGLIRYLYNGPRWFLMESEIENCANGFWEALLYIQNYRNPDVNCITQSWYLSVDFQLFIFTPFLLIPLKKKPKYTVPVMIVLSIVGMIIPFYIGYVKYISGVGEGMTTPAFKEYYYFLTYTRFAPYVIGMLFGYLIYRMKQKKNLVLHKEMVTFLWLITIAGHLVCLFDGYKLASDDSNQLADGLYLGFNKAAWSLSVSILILLCCTGYGGPVNTFLSLPILQIMSKLTYSMYIVHYLFIKMFNASSRTEVHISDYILMTEFFSHVFVSVIISICYTLLFESPMITIEKIIFRRR